MKKYIFLFFTLCVLNIGVYSESFPATDAGVKSLLKQFVDPKADIKQLTNSLKPTDKDIEDFFGSRASDAQKFYTSLWGSNALIAPKAGQTEFIFQKATSEEIKNWTKKVNYFFPGGYQKMKDHIKPGLTIYVFKFVKPKATTGMAYDGLVHLNGRWVIFPKCYRLYNEELK